MNTRDRDLGRGCTRGRNKKSNQFWLRNRFELIKSAGKWLRLPSSRNQTRSHLAPRALPPIQTPPGGRSHFCLILIKRAAKWLRAATKKSPACVHHSACEWPGKMCGSSATNVIIIFQLCLGARTAAARPVVHQAHTRAEAQRWPKTVGPLRLLTRTL